MGRTTSAILALAAALLACLPAAAGAAPRTIAPSGTIQGRPVHSGEGSPGSARTAVPLRVADPAAYAREKGRLAQLTGASAPLSAAGALGPMPGPGHASLPAAAVFGSLNVAGFSAAQQIAAFGAGADVTPPDTTGAIGPEDYVEFVNEEVAAYKRSNLAIVGTPVSLSTFTGGTAPCDPQIKYDPTSSRWFYSAIRCDGTLIKNELFVGFSKTSDPTDFSTAEGGGWCGYKYETGEFLEDYDKLGLDSSHIMIGSNDYEALTEAFVTAHVLSLPKPASGKIATCPAAPKLTTFGSKEKPLETAVESHLASTPQPATVAGEPASGYVVAADMTKPFSGNGSHLMLWQLAGTVEKPELNPLGAPAVTAYSIPPNVPQPGTKDQLDTLDGRLTQAVAAPDPGAGGAEAVWTQQTVLGGAGTVVRWYELLPGKLEVKQSGTISDPSLFVFNGAIAPTLSGGAVINYDTASKSALVQIAAQSRRGSDPAGTMGGAVTLASSAAIDSDFSCPSVEPRAPSCRWGDYAGASVDPNNADVVWGSNQFDGPAGKGHEAQWATQNFALTPVKAPAVVTKEASAVAQTAATLNAEVNPNGGEVSECKFEYGTSIAYGKTATCTPSPGKGETLVAVSASVTGLTANTTYHFRISATNAGGTSNGLDQTFKTLPPPTVETKAATSVTQTSATLNASVNPNGGLVSECKFEYGSTTSYGHSAPCTPSPGSGTTAVAVSAALESLAEGATYHFRISATNAGGTSPGGDLTFTTTLVLGPHWHKNGARLAESTLDGGLPVISWGSLTLENAKIGSFTCLTLAGGDLANPTGGGAGKGVLEGVTFYGCTAPTCEAAKGLQAVIPEKPEWSSVLIEEAGAFRDRIEGITLREICDGGTSNVQFHGMLKPSLEGGVSIGAFPAKLEFGAGSGELQSVEGAGKVAAKLKLMGYEGGEMIQVEKT
jgi:hypothetical protein